MSVAPIWTSRILDRRPFRLVPILLIAAFSWQWAMAQAAAPQSQRVIHESWTFKHGAPEGVSALAQTADGFLWLGAPAGLFRFDGVRFEPFRSPFGDQLLSTYVFALFAPPDGVRPAAPRPGYKWIRAPSAISYQPAPPASTGQTKKLF